MYMNDLSTQREYNRKLSEFLSELSKLQKKHLEQVQVVEKLPSDHYQLSAEMARLYDIEIEISDLVTESSETLNFYKWARI